MEDPVQEIKGVIRELYESGSPDAQRAAVYKYFAPNAGFHHPLSRVDPGVLSRESVLGIYQWYRILSPHVAVHVDNVVYDKPHNILLLDIVQQFKLFLSPVQSAFSRMLVRLTLKEEKGVHLIVMQEDFFHPEDLSALVFPPLATLTGFTLRVFGVLSIICGKFSQVLGYWRPEAIGIAHDKGQIANGHQKARGNGNDKTKKTARETKEKTLNPTVLSNVHQQKLAQRPQKGVGGNQLNYECGQSPFEAIGESGDESKCF